MKLRDKDNLALVELLLSKKTKKRVRRKVERVLDGRKIGGWK